LLLLNRSVLEFERRSTCVAHLLHNCAMKVKSHFHDVDQLIASIKAATVKNKSRQPQFAVGYSTRPIVTRWGSWLNAALYYARNLPEVKSIVESFEGSGVLVIQAKNSLQTPSLTAQLLKIKDQYECLVNLIDIMESAKCTIKEAVQAIQGLDFGEDTCNISRYIKKRIENNDILKIMSVERSDISPAVYSLLQHCQPSSASVESKFFYAAKNLGQRQKLCD